MKKKLLPLAIFFFLLIQQILPGHAELPRTMYILNGSAETLSKINLETGIIEQNIVKTGQIPNQILIHQQKIYVVNSGTDDLMIIDPQNDHQIERTIDLGTGNNPWFMAFVGSKKVYVTNWIGNSVSVVNIETGKIEKEITVGRAPQGILIVGNQALVTNTGYAGWGLPYETGTISIIDILTDSVTNTVEVPINPQDLALAPDGRIHVMCTGNYIDTMGKVAVLDLYTGPWYDTPAIVDTIPIGNAPGDIIITASGKGYCVAWGNGVDGALLSYDALADTIIHGAKNPITIGPNVSRLFYDGKTDKIWIPFMKAWGGDGFIQQFDPASDSLAWISGVVGNGTQDLAIMESLPEWTPGADKVVSFTPGKSAGFGQNYFPDNVFGMPDPSSGISAYNSSTRPQEILSLGHGGEIVLEFVDNYIVDETGADFTVFENAFYFLNTTMSFIEAAIVSVSADGENWYTFPWDTSTWKGLAGVTPTLDNQHPTDPTVSGGDQFDLADVGLQYARFVKLTDLGDIKKEGIFNGDFDLDAVVAVNSRPTAISEFNNPVTISGFELEQNFPNPFNPETTIRFKVAQAGSLTMQIYNLQGQIVKTLVNSNYSSGTYQVRWDGKNDNRELVTTGVYFCKMKIGNYQAVRRLILLK